jgi:TatD-related deoxyribonuclease
VPLPSDLPVVDHHCHLSPAGEGVAAARRFRAAGGTHLFLATQNYDPTPPTTLAAYERQFETTVSLGEAVGREAGVRAYPVLAPYPIDLLSQIDSLGPAAALELHLAALDLAGRWIEEGRAVALGEVGRPHFPVPADRQEAVETVFRHALEVARDVGCPAVLHTEDLDGTGFQGIAALAVETQFPLSRLVKHYHRTEVAVDAFHGVIPSYLARRETVARALTTPGPWFLETDFLDDPHRPGAVLDLATVPRRATAIASQGPEAAERLRIPFETSIEKVYGVHPRVTPEGGR